MITRAVLIYLLGVPRELVTQSIGPVRVWPWQIVPLLRTTVLWMWVKRLFPGAFITSGLRSREHNANVGGVPGSDHVHALGFDFFPGGNWTTADAARYLVDRARKAEKPVRYVGIYDGHIHVSLTRLGEPGAYMLEDKR